MSHKLLDHSTQGLREIQKNKRTRDGRDLRVPCVTAPAADGTPAPSAGFDAGAARRDLRGGHGRLHPRLGPPLRCPFLWRCLSYMCQTLAVTVLYMPDSGRDCLIYARIWSWLSYMHLEGEAALGVADVGRVVVEQRHLLSHTVTSGSTS